MKFDPTPKNSEAMPEFTPKFGGINIWCALTGMSVRATYDRLGTGDLNGVKVGTRTLVDIEKGLEWLRAQPPVQIKPQRRQQAVKAKKRK
jgi:hypothetical protein